MPTPEPTIKIFYTLRADDGSFEQETVHAAQVPRVGELITIDSQTSYQVIDVLWSSRGESSVVITACERSWHEHFEEVLQQREGAPDPTDARHLVELMQLIDWSDEDDTGSVIPERLNRALVEQHRWSMLQNALLDWDIIRSKGIRGDGDALFRLAVTYMLPVFEGAPPETDQALGELLAHMSSMCEAPGAVEGLGRRWREDLCATAWRLVLAYHRRDRARGY